MANTLLDELANLETLLETKPVALQAPTTPKDVDNAKAEHVAPSLKCPKQPPVVMMATGVGGTGPIRPTAAPQEEVLASTSKAPPVSFHVQSWRPDRMVPCPGPLPTMRRTENAMRTTMGPPWEDAENAEWTRIANDAHNQAIAGHFANATAPAMVPPPMVPPPMAPCPWPKVPLPPPIVVPPPLPPPSKVPCAPIVVPALSAPAKVPGAFNAWSEGVTLEPIGGPHMMWQPAATQPPHIVAAQLLANLDVERPRPRTAAPAWVQAHEAKGGTCDRFIRDVPPGPWMKSEAAAAAAAATAAATAVAPPLHAAAVVPPPPPPPRRQDASATAGVDGGRLLPTPPQPVPRRSDHGWDGGWDDRGWSAASWSDQPASGKGRWPTERGGKRKHWETACALARLQSPEAEASFRLKHPKPATKEEDEAFMCR